MTDENATVRRLHRAAREHLRRVQATREQIQALIDSRPPTVVQAAADASTNTETGGQPQ